MNFKQLTEQIEQTHNELQQHAVKAINISLTVRNWLIGCYIVEYDQSGQDRAKYGERLLEQIAGILKEKEIKGLPIGELSRCRQFYLVYPQILGTLSQESFLLPDSILGTLSQEFHLIENKNITIDIPQVDVLKLITNLSFSHFAELIKIQDPLKRVFYEIECIKGTWGVRELRRQINSLFYERTGLSQKPEKLIALTQENIKSVSASEIIKSPFSFDFLGLNAKDVLEEAGLENALMTHIQEFLLELGHGFCFEARQKRILIGDEYFFVDLVFYHRILHCHVLVEIKVDEFKHEHIGQLNVYLEHFKRNEMQMGDNPPVGILLVTEKNNTLVEYAKGSMDNNLFVSKYLLELPTKDQLLKVIEKEIKNI